MGRTNNDSSPVNQKYSDEVLQYGWVPVPNLMVHYQGELGLTDGELVTYIQLLTSWFYKHSQVYPSIARLAGYSKVSVSTIAARLRTLEKKGFITRNYRPGLTTIYDVKPGIAKLYYFQKTRLSNGNPLKNSRGYIQDSKPPPHQVSKSKEYEAGIRPSINKTNLASLKDIFKDLDF